LQVYLDNSSTTRPTDAVVRTLSEVSAEQYGNPSSFHTLGQDAEKIVKGARDVFAKSIGSKPEQIIFTGGGTESNNTAVYSSFVGKKNVGDFGLVISSIEHPSVAKPAEYLESIGVKLQRASVCQKDSDTPGLIDVSSLASLVDDKALLISIMHVNNEIGTIQDIGAVSLLKSQLVKDKKVRSDLILHTDAVQSFLKIPLEVNSAEFAGVDLISFSAHKIHGPKGVGALYAANPEKLSPFLLGGGQEKGLRSGTENVPGIAGFAKAISEATKGDTPQDRRNIPERVMQDHRNASARVIAGSTRNPVLALDLRTKLLEGIRGNIKDVLINSPTEASASGEPGKCSPYILNVSFLGTRGEVLVRDLESRGVYVSTGSACSALSGNKNKSDTLGAIGLTEKEREGAIRFSLSRFTTEEEIDYALEQVVDAVTRFRKIGAYR
jgi:cysteine desulfurase